MRLRSSIEAMLAQFDAAAMNRADRLANLLTGVAGAIGVLSDHVDAIEPARVDMPQALADDIVRKIHGPLTIPPEFSDWIRQQTRHAQTTQTYTFGHGFEAGVIELIMKPEGALRITISDSHRSPVWQATFVPPGFAGASQEP